MFHGTCTWALVAAVMAAAPLASVSWLPYVGEIVYGPQEDASVLVVPDGSGSAMSEARGASGGLVDATIRVRVVDYWYNPIPNIPAEDLWLQFAVDPGTATGCVHDPDFPGGVFRADRPTGQDGWTEFALPLRGGGYSPGPVYVYLVGSPACPPDQPPYPPLALRMNSPDITGDTRIDLTDATLFAIDYFGGYDYRSDLWWDGAINLSDLTKFSLGYLSSGCR